MLVPVILSGGSGTRLWPLSRESYPKQFIKVEKNKKSLLQSAVLRVPEKFSPPIIICNEEHRFIVAEQIREINFNCRSIILEPVGKNTAPAIALAAFELLKSDTDAIMLVLASDHSIKDRTKFHDALDKAIELSLADHIVTFGVTPSRAETGYGYIHCEKVNDANKIISFKEKPTEDVAKRYLESGNYFWNSGMFVFKARTYLEELKRYEPKIYSVCKKTISKRIEDRDFVRFDNKAFFSCPDKSIDTAVMENTNNGFVVTLDARWSDLGTWESIWNESAKDKNNNLIFGDVITEQTSNSLVYSPEKLIATIDVSDLVIVNTPDALLVSTKKGTSHIKKILEKLRAQNRSELKQNKLVYRPWGFYKALDTRNNYQIKLLVINPGEKISLQKHLKRSEHWVIVSGIATITRGTEIFECKKNESTFIPAGEIHRLENKTNNILEIIEIQTGDYFEEDDIIRFDDIYNRS